MFLFSNQIERFQKHILEHRFFIDKVSKFALEYFYNPKQLTQEMIEFLHSWVIHHIQGTDREYEMLCKTLTHKEINQILWEVNNIMPKHDI